MSRHRNFRNMNYDDERDDDDDESHRYSLSMDDDVAMSPSTAKFVYHRPRVTSSNVQMGLAVSDFIVEEEIENDVFPEDQFVLEQDEHCTVSETPVIAEASPVAFSISRLPEQHPNTAQHTQSKVTFSDAAVPRLENLRLEERQLKGITPNASYGRLSALALAQASPTPVPKTRHRDERDKPLINVVIVGHVDAGKSTLMGHLLYQMGKVDDRTMHKYKQEAARTGKASFAFAWVLDDTKEERERGVTMDIARTSLETEHRHIVLLDAPGHKDFIPNMITGAAQADAGLLVVNATRGEFETGFDHGGQTREHAMLLRALGVGELAVLVNKLDTVQWEEGRYNEVCTKLSAFLHKQAAFPIVRFVPVSGLEGVNLTSAPGIPWYHGPTLLQVIDELNAPIRAVDCALRAVISDVIKTSCSSLTVAVRVEAGHIETAHRLFIMPNVDPAIVKGVTKEDGGSVAFAGDDALLTLNAVNAFDADSFSNGQLICRGGKECIIPAKRLVVRLVVFNITIPIMKGTRAEMFAHSLCEPCTVKRIHSALGKTTGQVVKLKPRCLSRNMSGIVELETQRAVCVEPYSQCKPLGRITLRSNGHTLAAGIIESVIV